MIRRNGGVAKVVFGVCVFFVGVYLFYLYYDVSGRLKQTERTAERYRREGETASAQLQDLSMAKSELQQRCDSDKQEFTNRLNSLQQQYKMLKSQHEDMENDFGRLQNEKETEMEERKKLDEERTLEYNKFKQEKILEVSSLKDAVANLEREKQELTEEISKLKEQLQNNLKQVSLDKQNIASLEQQISTQKQQRLADQNLLLQYQAQLTQAKNMLQQQQQAAEQLKIQQQVQQQQNSVLGQGMMNMQNQNPSLLNQQANPQAGQQMFLGQGNRNMFNLPFGGPKINPQQDALKVVQQQQHQQQQEPNGVMGAAPHEQAFQPIVNEGVIQANEMLKSLQEKHKPVDPDVLEQQQQQHQILPPKEKPDLENYHKDSNIEGNPPQDPGKNLDKDEEGAGDDAHDNRIQQQGPVNLQVQEPNLKPAEDLKFHPEKPDAVDNQLQPNQPVDDSLKQEQMEVPVRPLAADNNLIHQQDNVNMGAKPMDQVLGGNNEEREEDLRPMQDDDKYDADEYENDENDDNDDNDDEY